MKQLVLAIILILAGISSAYALTLKEAKNAGLVGERNDGYVGYLVDPPSEETQLIVKEVNNKRRAVFSATAKKNNIEIKQVAMLFYQRAVEETELGNYYQDPEGNWKKK